MSSTWRENKHKVDQDKVRIGNKYMWPGMHRGSILIVKEPVQARNAQHILFLNYVGFPYPLTFLNGIVVKQALKKTGMYSGIVMFEGKLLISRYYKKTTMMSMNDHSEILQCNITEPSRFIRLFTKLLLKFV